METFEWSTEFYIESAKEEYGEDFKLDFEVKKVDKVSDKSRKEIVSMYEELDAEVDDVRQCTICFTITDEDGKKTERNLKLNTIKVDGKWYVDIFTQELL